MNLCIPYNVIEPIVSDLSSQSWFNAPKAGRTVETKQRIAGTLNRAALTVTGLLAETTITLHDLMHLSVGDMLTTERPASSPVVLCVENEKAFLGHIGQYKGQRALKVLRAVGPSDRV
jgi:flagellar motor switch protein FliM